jgi:hypothetical protein
MNPRDGRNLRIPNRKMSLTNTKLFPGLQRKTYALNRPRENPTIPYYIRTRNLFSDFMVGQFVTRFDSTLECKYIDQFSRCQYEFKITCITGDKKLRCPQTKVREKFSKNFKYLQHPTIVGTQQHGSMLRRSTLSFHKSCCTPSRSTSGLTTQRHPNDFHKLLLFLTH